MLKPILYTAAWFSAFVAGGYASAAERQGPCDPNKASYVSEDPLTGKETFVFIVKEKVLVTPSGTAVRHFGVKRCQAKKNPETGMDVWRLEKNAHTVSEAEIGSLLEVKSPPQTP